MWKIGVLIVVAVTVAALLLGSPWWQVVLCPVIIAVCAVWGLKRRHLALTSSEVMEFRDHFIEVEPGFLIDPVLKLRVHFGGSSGLEPNEAFLRIGYDPEINPDRLLVPPSEEDRKFWLMSPVTAHLAEVPKIFQSARYDEIGSLSLRWTVEGDRVRYKIEDNVYLFKLTAKIIKNKQYPNISDSGRNTLLYAISSAGKLTDLEGENFLSPKYAHINLIEIWIRSDVLVDFFNLQLAEFKSPEPGWVILSSWEIPR